MSGSFGTGHPPTHTRLVETVQRVASPPHAGLAREGLTFRVDGVEQVVEIVRQERFLGGLQGFWVCPKCAVLRQHLYVVGGALACRVCHGLSYRSRHVPRAIARAAKLRRRLGSVPGLLSPIPRKPRHWSPVYYRRLIAELLQQERVLAEMLGGTVRALERRLHHGRRR